MAGLDRKGIVGGGRDLACATAVILAGGLGTRLAPVVADRPKVLATVGTRPFLALLLDRLAAAGIERALLCTGHRGADMRAAVGTDYRGMRIAYSQEPTPAGTGGALRLAAARLDDDPLLVLNGDSFCDVDLVELWNAHRDSGATGTVVVVEVPDARAFGRVRCAADGSIESFAEKSDDPGPAWVNAGVYVLSRALVDAIAPTPPVSLEREVMPAWVGRGLAAHPVRGAFFDIGTPSSYAAAQGRVLEMGVGA